MSRLIALSAVLLVAVDGAPSCSDEGSGVGRQHAQELVKIVNETFLICDGIFGKDAFEHAVKFEAHGDDKALLTMICQNDPPSPKLRAPLTNVCAQYFAVLASLPAWKECDEKVRSQDAMYSMAMEIHKCKKAEAATSDQMPVAELKPEYIRESTPRSVSLGNASGNNFVFLQKFPLGGVNLFYHTEVLVCPRDGFSSADQATLDGQIANMTDFSEIDESWWNTRTANCVELGYGGANCNTECCSVPQGTEQTQYALNARRAVIGNADTSQKSLYIYGTGGFDGTVAFHDTCDHKCWSNWAGTDYNPITNNCNTFTSTVLFCVYGLSQKKPNLGPSDLRTVSGHCPAKSMNLIV